MPNKTKNKLVPMEHTHLIPLEDSRSTLPLDTAKELTKTLAHINDLLGLSIKEQYLEEIEDINGNKHLRTKFHPLMMKLFDEQRKRIDQMHKILGGQLKQDIVKETAKITAKMIFDASKNQKSKCEEKERAHKILEVEYYEDDQD